MKNPKLTMIDCLRSGYTIKDAYREAYDRWGASDKECLRATSQLCKNDERFARTIERISFDERTGQRW